jgi:hypothetical protein
MSVYFSTIVSSFLGGTLVRVAGTPYRLCDVDLFSNGAFYTAIAQIFHHRYGIGKTTNTLECSFVVIFVPLLFRLSAKIACLNRIS